MAKLNRRNFLYSSAALAALAAAPGALRPAAAAAVMGEPFEFSYEKLVERARDSATKPYVPPYRPDPEIVQKIDYEQHGKLKFKTSDSPFAGNDGAYPATFFHLCLLYTSPSPRDS